MSIKDRKESENAQLKQKILSAALRIFSEQGYGRVSMRKIASLIDYSPTTIYRFFRSKEELLQAIAAETYGNLSARFEKVKAEGREDPLGTLKSLLREYIGFCLERPDMFKLYSDLCSFEMEDGVIYERLGQTRHRVYQSWFQGIRQAGACGRLSTGDELRVFFYLWDAVNGYIDHRVRYPGFPGKAGADDAAGYLDLVFRGIETTRNS